ncbi:hypothetical protein EC991_003030 [Linnemannia zychae]|nr:hypothetical protein EC991_003030 [Linnemannia zychae]
MTTIDESNSNATGTNSNVSKRNKRKVVRIDIYSDTTCPWCYITKKRLEKAIRTFQHASSSLSSAAAIDAIHKESENSIVASGCSSLPAQQEQQQQSPSTTSLADLSSSSTIPTQPHPSEQQHQKQDQKEEEIHFDIHWRPFLLDPNAPRVPIRRTQLYHRKFGPENALKVQDRIVNAGKVEGIRFLYTDQSLYNNTIDSHRMLRFARERLGRLPIVSNEGTTAQGGEEVEVEGTGRKMVDSGNSNGTPHDQDPQDYFHVSIPATNTDTSSEEHEQNDDDEEEEEEEEVDELGARMEDAMVDELFRSHFERGECSEFETLKSCARSVLIQTAAFSAAAAAALASAQLPLSTSFASPLQDQQQTSPYRADADTNTNNTNQHLSHSLPSEEYTRLLKAKEQELIEQQLQELDQYLHSDEGLDEVMEEIRVAKEDLGMQGVPMIVIQNEYLLSGAQTPATFVQVLQRVI